ncbi:ABC transporter permease [Marivirga arenosa]|uniref:ABC transporter permease n=1 Tax=Marivirga arenosa TaxID=3059076 RepID=A0AA51N4D1_9BACT|nr:MULTISPECIES: ABC transporter permease [unclassified Marivirga]WMN05994.1 ABC transporter permease [Marivirga sp. ABR2-2]WNB17652.1 ABC transporter permease [Marivirga sp. BKB1-2]
MIYFHLLLESFRFAISALRANLLRTILSLLGVTVGIFSIITVFTLVDSLEKNIRDSLNFLGDDVIRIEKFPWIFEDNYPWWKYVNRPKAEYSEYQFLKNNSKEASAVTIFAERFGVTVKHESNSLSGAIVSGIAYQHKDVFEIPVEKGRYFGLQEVEKGANVSIIGAEVANTLFPLTDPVGKEIKLRGLKFRVIGVMEKQGASVIDAPSADDFCYVPYNTFFKMYSGQGNFGVESIIALKGYPEDEGLKNLEGEITGLLRQIRGLRPREDTNFAVNRPEAFADVIGSIFSVISLAGWVIGSFSILVGGFGIANIMFVSVKERTNIIGIQKSLGAKNFFILFQFLFEAVFLSVLGGMFGLLLVYLLSFVSLGSLDLSLSFSNVILGVSVSVIIGTVSGIVPAGMASKLDPVIAIRA